MRGQIFVLSILYLLNEQVVREKHVLGHTDTIMWQPQPRFKMKTISFEYETWSFPKLGYKIGFLDI